MSRLQIILQKLEKSRILNQVSEKIELSHDIIAGQIAARRTAEDKFLIEWELLIRNKHKDCQKSEVKDYLTTAQLSAVDQILHKIRLDQSELDYLADSKAFHRNEKAKKRRHFYFYAAAIIVVMFIIACLMFWAIAEKSILDRETTRKKSILSNLYFYAGRYALIVNKDSGGQLRYGFMDKEGKTLIPFDYTEARPFDEFGYARVKIQDKLYLIDTFNNRYPLAETTLAINDSTLAISLKEQQLVELPAEIVGMEQLRVLYLKGNQLKTLPEKFSGLKNLHTLDLGFNKLDKLPAAILNNPNLVHLDLQKNELDSLDLVNTQLSNNLEYLNLSKNKIDFLPDWIRNLKKLQILDLSENNISNVPDKLAEMTGLKKLNLFGNPIRTIPEKLKNSQIDLYLNTNFVKNAEDKRGSKN